MMSKRLSLFGPSGKAILICFGRFSSDMSAQGGTRSGQGRQAGTDASSGQGSPRSAVLRKRAGKDVPFCKRSSLAEAFLTPCFAFSAFSLLSRSCFSC